jgi:hypothetical protein
MQLSTYDLYEKLKCDPEFIDYLKDHEGFSEMEKLDELLILQKLDENKVRNLHDIISAWISCVSSFDNDDMMPNSFYADTTLYTCDDYDIYYVYYSYENPKYFDDYNEADNEFQSGYERSYERMTELVAEGSIDLDELVEHFGEAKGSQIWFEHSPNAGS